MEARDGPAEAGCEDSRVRMRIQDPSGATMLAVEADRVETEGAGVWVGLRVGAEMVAFSGFSMWSQRQLIHLETPMCRWSPAHPVLQAAGVMVVGPERVG